MHFMFLPETRKFKCVLKRTSRDRPPAELNKVVKWNQKVYGGAVPGRRPLARNVVQELVTKKFPTTAIFWERKVQALKLGLQTIVQHSDSPVVLLESSLAAEITRVASSDVCTANLTLWSLRSRLCRSFSCNPQLCQLTRTAWVCASSTHMWGSSFRGRSLSPGLK